MRKDFNHGSPVPVNPAFTPKTNGNGRSGHHRPVPHVRHGVNVAVLKATTALRRVEKEGLSLAHAALSCGTTVPYIKAKRDVEATRNFALINAVETGNMSLLPIAARLEHAAAAIMAYDKCNTSDEYQLFETATGTFRDLTRHIRNSDPVEAAIAFIDAVGGVDAAIDLLIAATRKTAATKLNTESISEPVSEPTFESAVSETESIVIDENDDLELDHMYDLQDRLEAGGRR